MAGAEGADSDEPRDDPRTKLMEEVADQMDAIEGDLGDNYEIGAVLTIVEVMTQEGPTVRIRSNAPPWIGLGLLSWAKNALESQQSA